MGPELRRRERISRRDGSGIDRTALLGSWRLRATWPRRGERPATLAAALLRGLQATLALLPGGDPDVLLIHNSVRLGALELRFEGRARLEGRRPLLLFRFEKLQLYLGSRLLLERPIAPSVPFPEQRAGVLPFFALIACERRGLPAGNGSETGWLAARGRGGGLALWQLEAVQAAAAPLRFP